MELDGKCPTGPIESRWTRHKAAIKLINPANKRKYNLIMVGSGLAGASGAASLAELGYNVSCFCYQDSPRRAHSIAAQGGINAAKNYQNDGDSVYRLFYDTVKGGDFRARESNVYRLAEVSNDIIDQCVAQGVPFGREYGGTLANRSFGGAQVSRTFYARGQTGQQLLIGAYQALERQIGLGKVKMYPRTEMLDLIVVDGVRARHRRPRHGHRQGLEPLRRRRHARDGRLRERLLPLDEREGLQRDRHLARPPARRLLREPLLHADPPDLHPGPRRQPEQADAHVRVAPQRRPDLGAAEEGRDAQGGRHPRGRARLLPRAQVPELRQPRPPRHLLARGQAGLRRGARRRAGRPGRLPRLRRVDRPARRERHPRAVREPLRDVREDHRREPVQGPDADLPGRPLHDGRPLGRLQPHVEHPGALRPRRGELLRPRREPPRRLRAHAGSRRRLLRHPLHDRQLPRAGQAREGRRHAPGREGGRGRRHRADEEAPLHQGEADRRLPPQAARAPHVGELRHGPHPGGPRAGDREDPGASRGVLEERLRPRERRGPERRRSRRRGGSPTSSSSTS